MNTDLKVSDRLIVSLDAPSTRLAMSVVDKLANHVGTFRVGMGLLAVEGSKIIDDLHSAGVKVFYDMKFKDIPQTVAEAVWAVSSKKVWMLSIHGDSGHEVIIEAAKRKQDSLLATDTVLTYFSRDEASLLWKNIYPPSLIEAGADALICASSDLPMLNMYSACPCIRVVPDVRPSWERIDICSRVGTPEIAMGLGATYLIMGKPIIEPAPWIGDSKEAVKRVIGEMEQGISRWNNPR